MKLWSKANTTTSALIENFTVGKDREMDLYLSAFDILGSLAHTTMLESVGLLTKEELNALRKELLRLYQQVLNNEFTLADNVEDIHSQIELLLTERLGDVGKRIHSAR